MATHTSSNIVWETVVKDLFPSIIGKFGMGPKSITSKKMWEKMKDIKLSELGLTESIVEESLRVFYNHPTPLGDPKKDSPPSPSPRRLSVPSINRNPSESPPKYHRTISGTSQIPMMPTEDEPPVRNFRKKLNSYKSGIESNEAKKLSASLGDLQVGEESKQVRTFKTATEGKYQSEEKLSPASSPRGEPLPELPALRELIDVKEVLEGSPMLHQQLKVAEIGAIQFGAHLKKVLTFSRDVCEGNNVVALGLQRTAEMLGIFRSNYASNDSDEVTLSQALLEMSKVILDVENARVSFASETATHLVTPIEHLLADLKDLSRLKRTLESLNPKKQRLTNTILPNGYIAFLAEGQAEQELANSKLKMQLTGVEFAFHLNSLEKVSSSLFHFQKRKFQLLMNVCEWFLRYSAFFSKAHTLCQSVQQTITQTKEFLSLRKSQWDPKQNLHRKRSTMEQVLRQSPSQEKSTTKQGYLFRRKGQIKQHWKKHFFIVTEGMMMEKKTLNVFPLLTSSVKLRPDLDIRCFEVVTPEKHYILQSESAEATSEWVNVLQNVISQQLNDQGDSQAKDPQTPLDIVRAFHLENTKCADCAAPNPDWASINLGVVTCIECSGIHRSLGVHISKVRSLTLDKWNSSLLQLFRCLGNAKVNNVLEATIPEGITKPSPKSDREQREKWIRSKYVLRRFVAPQTFQDPQREILSAITADDPLLLLRVHSLGLSLDQPNASQEGRTPLLHAIFSQKRQCIQFLVLNGANPLNVDNQHWNAFHHAAKNNDSMTVRLLLKSGAFLEGIDATDAKGQTATDIAASLHNSDVLEVFFDCLPKSKYSLETTTDQTAM